MNLGFLSSYTEIYIFIYRNILLNLSVSEFESIKKIKNFVSVFLSMTRGIFYFFYFFTSDLNANYFRNIFRFVKSNSWYRSL